MSTSRKQKKYVCINRHKCKEVCKEVVNYVKSRKSCVMEKLFINNLHIYKCKISW